MINKRSKIFVIIFLTLSIVSISITYYRYVVLRDFEIITDEEAFNESLLD